MWCCAEAPAGRRLYRRIIYARSRRYSYWSRGYSHIVDIHISSAIGAPAPRRRTNRPRPRRQARCRRGLPVCRPRRPCAPAGDARKRVPDGPGRRVPAALLARAPCAPPCRWPAACCPRRYESAPSAGAKQGGRNARWEECQVGGMMDGLFAAALVRPPPHRRLLTGCDDRPRTRRQQPVGLTSTKGTLARVQCAW